VSDEFGQPLERSETKYKTNQDRHTCSTGQICYVALIERVFELDSILIFILKAKLVNN